MQNESYKFLYESVKDKFDFIRDADNTFDTKVGVLIAIVIGVLTIYFTTVKFEELDPYKMNFAVGGIVFALLALIILVLVQYPKKYRTVLGDEKLIEEYLNKNESDLLLQLISDTQFAFKENKDILDNKVYLYKVALLVLGMSLVLLLLSALPIINIKI